MPQAFPLPPHTIAFPSAEEAARARRCIEFTAQTGYPMRLENCGQPLTILRHSDGSMTLGSWLRVTDCAQSAEIRHCRIPHCEHCR